MATQSVFHQILRPTAVELSVVARFIHPQRASLILAKKTVLEVYELQKLPKTSVERRVHKKKERLVLYARYDFHGTIKAMCASRVAGHSRECLIICFEDSQVVTIEYNPATNDIVTTSMHSFEKEIYEGGRFRQEHYPLCVADPSQQCAAIPVSETKMLILPLTDANLTFPKGQNKLLFHRDLEDDERKHKPQLKEKTLFTIDLAALGIRQVKDIAFLHGYDEPSLLILHQPRYTWAGRASVQEHACSVVAISLNLYQKSYSVICKGSDLPYDCRTLVPLPMPTGGAFILSSSTMLHFAQAVDYGVSVNDLGKLPKTSLVTLGESQVVFNLSKAVAISLDAEHVLLCIEGGDILLVIVSGTKLYFRKVQSDMAPYPSCICQTSRDTVFIGSRLSDSMLLRLSFKEPDAVVDLSEVPDILVEKPEVVTIDADEPMENGDSSKANGDTSKTAATEDSDDDSDIDAEMADLFADDDDDEDDADAKEDSESTKDENAKSEKEEKSSETNSKRNGKRKASDSDEDVEMNGDGHGGGKANGEDAKAKKRRKFMSVDGDDDSGDDSDELGGLFGDADAKERKIRRQNLTVSEEDRLHNLAPIVDFEVSQTGKLEDKTLSEVVTCSGRGHTAAVNTIFEGVRPQYITDLPLYKEYTGCWTLRKDGTKLGPDDEDPFDSFLLISNREQTLVLATEGDLRQIETTGFYTEGQTICCGHIMNYAQTLQVFEHGVRTLVNVSGVIGVEIPIEESIVEADLKDPFLVVRLADGSLRVYVVQEDGNLELREPTLADTEEAGKVTAISVFKDDIKERCFRPETPLGRQFNMYDDDDDDDFSYRTKKEEMADKEDAAIEAMLFGDGESDDDEDDKPVVEDKKFVLRVAATTFSTNVIDVDAVTKGKVKAEGMKPEGDSDVQIVGKGNGERPQRKIPSAYCAVTRENGRLEIYSLPEFKRLFAGPNFPSGLQVVRNSLCRETRDQEAYSDVNCEEICLTRLGSRTKAYLMAFLTNGDLLVYEVYHFDPRPKKLAIAGGSYIPLRLSKVKHEFITRPLKRHVDDEEKESGDSAAGAAKELSVQEQWSGGRRFVPFSNVAQRSGVFIGGRRCAWVFGERGYFRMHPMTTRRGISALTSFHHVNCDHGAILFDTEGVLKIVSLPDPKACVFDSEMPFHRVPIRKYVHFVRQHKETNTYIVAVSEETEVLSLEMPTKRSLKIYQNKFSVQVFDAKEWIPQVKYDLFDEHEYIMCMTEANIEYRHERSHNVTKVNFIICGTGYEQGEDDQCKGRMHVFQLEPPRPGVRAKKKTRLSPSCIQEERSPITSMCAVGSLLAASIGPKIMLFYWNGSNLVGCAFLDMKFCAVSMSPMKNFLFVADAFRSVYFLLWEPSTKQLLLLSRDNHWLSTYTTDYLVDGKKLNMMVTDAEQNLQLFYYAPREKVSRGGQLLQLTADFHAGAHINRMAKLRARDVTEALDQRYFSLAGTLDGGLAYMCPVTKEVFERLYRLHFQMTYKVEHYGGLNPRAYRKYRARDKSHKNTKKNIIDGDLVFRYLHLDIYKQTEIARDIEMKPAEIIDDLLHIDLMTNFY